MTIWFIHRDNSNAIIWAGQYQQPGYADEQLDDAVSGELQAFLTAQRALTQDQVDANAATADSAVKALKQLTPAQAAAFISNNVTSLATAIPVLQTMAKILCILARRL